MKPSDCVCVRIFDERKKGKREGWMDVCGGREGRMQKPRERSTFHQQGTDHYSFPSSAANASPEVERRDPTSLRFTSIFKWRDRGWTTWTCRRSWADFNSTKEAWLLTLKLRSKMMLPVHPRHGNHPRSPRPKLQRRRRRKKEDLKGHPTSSPQPSHHHPEIRRAKVSGCVCVRLLFRTHPLVLHLTPSSLLTSPHRFSPQKRTTSLPLPPRLLSISSQVHPSSPAPRAGSPTARRLLVSNVGGSSMSSSGGIIADGVVESSVMAARTSGSGTLVSGPVASAMRLN